MTREPVQVRIDDKRFIGTLDKLAARSENLTEPLAACGQIVLASVEENFMRQGRYSTADSWRGGTNRWKPLAASTKKALVGGSKGYKLKGGLRAKAKRILSGHKILQRSGQLAGSIHSRSYKNHVEIGTNKTCGAAHQYGVNDTVTVGSHTRTSSRGKSYSVKSHSRKMKLPARPYLVIQDEDINDMIDVLDRHIMKP